jgi:hypothetical protein
MKLLAEATKRQLSDTAAAEAERQPLPVLFAALAAVRPRHTVDANQVLAMLIDCAARAWRQMAAEGDR